MMKRTLCIALTLVLVLSLRVGAAEVSAKSAIVYEPTTGAVLFEKNADERMLIASTTKIMTALVALEHCALDEKVEVRPEHCAVEGSSMYLRPGGDYTVEDILFGLLLVSGNDAAAALADHTAGSMESFAQLMNDKCAALGLENTHFENAHGLDAPEHYSTARDLAVIAACAMENGDFRRISGCKSCEIDGVRYNNHNKLLSLCDGCIGGKTGYTMKAGRSLVSCTERDGMRLICVTLSAPDDWNDHMALYDEAFAEYELVPALPQRYSRLEVMSGFYPFAELCAAASGMVVRRGSEVAQSIRLPRFVFAPVAAGDIVGRSVTSADGALLITPIVVKRTVPIDGTVPLTPFERFKNVWYAANRYGVYYTVR